MKKIIAYGEILLRLTPTNYQIIENSKEYEAYYGGTEANVLIALANLNNEVSYISKLPDNALGYGAISFLNKYQVDTSNVILDGQTMGLYFMEQGFGCRPSKVLYQRKNSSINTLKYEDLNVNKIFKGASWFHVSGISLAISNNSFNVTLSLLKKAKELNLKTSFDFNYRSSLISKEKARLLYLAISPYVDVCFANLFDLKEILKIKGESEDEIFLKALNEFNITYLISTNRQIINSQTHQMIATIYYKKDNKLVKLSYDSQEFEVLNRIGGGDAFVAGVIDRLNNNFTKVSEALKLGVQCFILKHSINEDVLSLNNTRLQEALNNQDKDVKR